MWLRVYAMIMRHLYLFRRSTTRLMGLLFWPVMSLLVWGFVTMYLKSLALPGAALFFLGAIIFWDILFRSQQAITLSITEEVWVKNIINLFIAPIRTYELLLASCAVGLLRAMFTTMLLGVLAALLYAFNIFDLGLAPFIGNLLLFGWAVGLATVGLVLRYGHAAEALIWGVPFIIQPISAVFYPVSVLPRPLQIVALCLPSTHVFEGMRHVLAHGSVEIWRLGLALGLNLVYLTLGAIFFGWILRRVREKGYLGRLNME